MLELRDYKLTDSAQLEQLVATNNDSENTLFTEARTTPRYTRTIIAKLNEEIVGFATLYQNQLHYHPNDFRLSIVVSEEARKQGVDSKLHEAVIKDLPVELARVRAASPEHSASSAFFETLGYYPLLRSYSPSLNVNSIETDKYDNVLKALRRSGYHITNLAELGRDATQSLVDLYFQVYADNHTHSPPTPDEDWQDIFLGEDVVDEAFFVAIRKGVPVGFSSLQAGEPHEMESMWDGVDVSERALAYPLRLALKLREVSYAKQKGITTIHWEVDSTDLVGIQLMKTLPFEAGSAQQIWTCEVYSA